MDIFMLIAIGVGLWWYFSSRARAQSRPNPNEPENIQYIRKNIRPFKFGEWLAWPVEPPMVKNYLMRMGVIFVIFFGSPLFLGWPLMIELIIGIIAWTDYGMYRYKLVLEVTLWNPEYMERFGPK